MRKLILSIVSVFLIALLSAHAEEPASQKDEHYTWHSITMIDYKPGTLEEVRTLIRKFETASVSAGTDVPDLYWFKSGKYDLVLTWKLKEGNTDFQGKWSPYGEPWWNALVHQEGSEEAARKLQSQYNNLVASSVTTLARKAQ
jgi:hypothetical protein